MDDVHRLAEDFQALAHPLRLRALLSAAERMVSPKALAAEHGAPLRVMAYHVRVLAERGLIEQVGSRQVRGALAHDYGITVRGLEVVVRVHSWPLLDGQTAG